MGSCCRPGFLLNRLNISVPTDPGRWLVRFAALTVAAALGLVCLGGLVTSKGVGMAVPDWPTTYGYNMFFFPLEKWTGGIFHEHLHRLVASGVGMLTIVLAVWLQWRAPNATLKKLGWLALVLVLVQGLLGGLRVVLDKHVVADTTLGTVFGLLHACLAQSFFVLLCVILLLLTSMWRRLAGAAHSVRMGPLPWLLPVTVGVIFLQLVLGGLMRHQHAGLAIHDFPLAYGKLWPATDPAALAAYNQFRNDEAPVTAFQIGLQMFHRLGAVLAVTLVVVCYFQSRRFPAPPLFQRGMTFWLGLLATQFSLGVATLLTDKAADVATAHMAVGALSLATGMLLTLVVRRLAQPGVRNFANERASVPVFAKSSPR